MAVSLFIEQTGLEKERVVEFRNGAEQRPSVICRTGKTPASPLRFDARSGPSLHPECFPDKDTWGERREDRRDWRRFFFGEFAGFAPAIQFSFVNEY
jgi:hypothetical protein